MSSFDSNIFLFKVKIADVITKQLMRIGEIEIEHDSYSDALFLASCLADKWDEKYLNELNTIEGEVDSRSRERYPNAEGDAMEALKCKDWAGKQKTLKIVEASMRLMSRCGMLPTKGELQVAAGDNISGISAGISGINTSKGYPEVMKSK